MKNSAVMGIIDKLAAAPGSRDEVPNIAPAKHIVKDNDKKAIKEPVENLSNKSKGIQNDCIKVLYEAGGLKPSLISPYIKEFISLLTGKNNRLQWGAMTALHTIAAENPEAVHFVLPQIISAANSGSVITRDYAVNILISLCAVKKYAGDAFSLLIEQLHTCPGNQLPMYAEKAMPVVNDKNKMAFINVLSSRLDDIEKDTKRKRVEKVISKLSKK